MWVDFEVRANNILRDWMERETERQKENITRVLRMNKFKYRIVLS